MSSVERGAGGACLHGTSLVLAFGLAALPCSAAFAADYALVPLVFLNLGGTPFSVPNVSESGNVTFRNQFPPKGLLRYDGNALEVVATTGDPPALGSRNPAINDFGQIVIDRLKTGTSGWDLMRYEADDTPTVLASIESGGSGDYTEVSKVAINNVGEVAALVRRNDGSHAIVRFEATGVTVIADDSTFTNFGSSLSIIDSGVVFFAARRLGPPDPGGDEVFSGDGGPLVSEGLIPGFGGLRAQANNDGLTAVAGFGNGFFLVEDGTVTTVPVPGIPPSGSGKVLHASINDVDQVAYGFNSTGSVSFIDGIFLTDTSGATPHPIVQIGDPLFGGTVSSLRMGPQALSNGGDIVFLANTVAGGSTTQHVVLASPVSEPIDIGAALSDQFGVVGLCRNSTTGDSDAASYFGTDLSCSSVSAGASSGDSIVLYSIGLAVAGQQGIGATLRGQTTALAICRNVSKGHTDIVLSSQGNVSCPNVSAGVIPNDRIDLYIFSRVE